MQEWYSHCAWRLLISCVLMSRVSSHTVKANAVSSFFEEWPTPTAALAAAPEQLQRILHPLGLFDNRVQSIVAVSERFLIAPVFTIELKGENKIYGIGEFGLQSFLIFARGNLDIVPGDATLKSFVAWQKRQLGKKGAAAESE